MISTTSAMIFCSDMVLLSASAPDADVEAEPEAE